MKLKIPGRGVDAKKSRAQAWRTAAKGSYFRGCRVRGGNSLGQKMDGSWRYHGHWPRGKVYSVDGPV